MLCSNKGIATKNVPLMLVKKKIIISPEFVTCAHKRRLSLSNDADDCDKLTARTYHTRVVDVTRRSPSHCCIDHSIRVYSEHVHTAILQQTQTKHC